MLQRSRASYRDGWCPDSSRCCFGIGREQLSRLVGGGFARQGLTRALAEDRVIALERLLVTGVQLPDRALGRVRAAADVHQHVLAQIQPGGDVSRTAVFTPASIRHAACWRSRARAKTPESQSNVMAHLLPGEGVHAQHGAAVPMGAVAPRQWPGCLRRMCLGRHTRRRTRRPRGGGRDRARPPPKPRHANDAGCAICAQHHAPDQ